MAHLGCDRRFEAMAVEQVRGFQTTDVNVKIPQVIRHGFLTTNAAIGSILKVWPME